MATFIQEEETLTRAPMAHGPELRQILLAQIRRRTGSLPLQPTVETDFREIRRRKMTTMVQGLFVEKKWAEVLRSLERTVAFLHADTIETLLMEAASDQTAGQLASLYLRSRGFKTPGVEAPGCSDGERCYLTSDYFWHKSPFADFLVYDCAHTFCAEGWLSVARARRETFARACEAYSRVLELATDLAGRLRLVEEMDGDDMFAPVAELVGQAVRARNGWKVLLLSA